VQILRRRSSLGSRGTRKQPVPKMREVHERLAGQWHQLAIEHEKKGDALT
jgi:hypothetical protein